MRVLGLMSGTSLDAIDVALVDIENEDRTLLVSLLGWTEEPWPSELRERIRGWSDEAAVVRVADIASASMEIGAHFAAAAERGAAAAGVSLQAIDLISSHGQTVHHEVDRAGRALSTLQLGEPAVIAERTGRTVVADFRPRDIAAGGQGAPLVSFVDALLFARDEHTVAALNLGGIANVTIVPAGAPFEAVAFDTGPANAPIDGCARRLLAHPIDHDGALAAAGEPSEQLLSELLSEPYFERPPPKSTGRELFGDAFVAGVLARAAELHLDAADVLASVTALSALSAAQAIARWSPAWPEDIYVSGGGTRNPTLLRALERALAEEAPNGTAAPRLRLVEEAGLPAAAKEAVAFAILGHETLFARRNSLPGATGARHASVLGAIWPGDDHARLLRLAAEGQRANERVDRIVVRRSTGEVTRQRKGG